MENETQHQYPRLVMRCVFRVAILIVCLAGCSASVSIRKVPTPTQYVEWTDELQRQADEMEGLRYYLPRPFVNVFESFPIRTDIYLANGMVSPDGKYVIVTSVTAESGLSRYIATDPRRVEIPTGVIHDRGQELGAAPHAAGAGGASEGNAVRPHAASLAAGLAAVETVLELKRLADKVQTGVVGKRAAQPPPATTPPPPVQSTPVAPTGQNQRTMTNDNGAFAYQPLRGNFDLVYLPDFEEQYVVSSASGLGNAMFEVNLGQGWSLQGFNSLEDNSELNKRIFDLIDTSIHIAKTAASAALGVPLPFPTTPGDERIMPHSGGALADKPQIPGTPVTLKIVVVHYAAKGLYPVIKPRELQERALAQTNTYGVLDLFRLLPKVTWASSFDPTAISRAQQAIDNQTGSYSVPRYPYQYISFNTFRYMAIEVVRPTDDTHSPFLHMYDKTGTQGDSGDARTGEIDVLLKSLYEFFAMQQKRGNGQPPPPPPTCKKPTDAVLDGLGESVKTEVSANEIEKIEFGFADCKLTPTVTLNATVSDKDTLKAKVKQATDKVRNATASASLRQATVADPVWIEPQCTKPADNTLDSLGESVKTAVSANEIEKIEFEFADCKLTPTVTLSKTVSDKDALKAKVTQATDKSKNASMSASLRQATVADPIWIEPQCTKPADNTLDSLGESVKTAVSANEIEKIEFEFADCKLTPTVTLNKPVSDKDALKAKVTQATDKSKNASMSASLRQATVEPPIIKDAPSSGGHSSP